MVGSSTPVQKNQKTWKGSCPSTSKDWHQLGTILGSVGNQFRRARGLQESARTLLCTQETKIPSSCDMGFDTAQKTKKRKTLQGSFPPPECCRFRLEPTEGKYTILTES